MALAVDLGPMPDDEFSGRIVMRGLRGLLESGDFCDVELVVAGQTFMAHRTVLAAASPAFREVLLRLGADAEGLGAAPQLEGTTVAEQNTLRVQLVDITHHEAIRAMLNCIYGTGGENAPAYDPGSEEANLDVLRLAQRFQIAQLQEQACRWLANGLTTDNVLQRLAACEEFQLGHVCEKILEQLTANPEALFILANDKKILTVPRVLQELLVRVLKLLGCGSESQAPAQAPATSQPPHGKRAKKAGA